MWNRCTLGGYTNLGTWFVRAQLFIHHTGGKGGGGAADNLFGPFGAPVVVINF